MRDGGGDWRFEHTLCIYCTCNMYCTFTQSMYAHAVNTTYVLIIANTYVGTDIVP